MSSEIDAFWQGAASAARSRYENIKLIGSGAYSVVARAVDTKTGKPVAIKRIAEVFYDATEAKKVLREIRLLRDYAHPNIIMLRALIQPDNMEKFEDIFMVTDFMDSDLRRIIKSRERIQDERVRSARGAQNTQPAPTSLTMPSFIHFARAALTRSGRTWRSCWLRCTTCTATRASTAT